MKKLDEVVSDAEQAFWKSVAESYPTRVGGDLRPEVAARLLAAMRDATVAWRNTNVPIDPDRKPVVHALKYGMAVCGVGRPDEFEGGDRWAGFPAEAEVVSCPECSATFDKDVEHRQALLVRRKEALLKMDPDWFTAKALAATIEREEQELAELERAG